MQSLCVFLCVSSLQCTQRARTQTLCRLMNDRFCIGFRSKSDRFGPLLPRNAPAAPPDSLLHPSCAFLRRCSAWIVPPALDEHRAVRAAEVSFSPLAVLRAPRARNGPPELHSALLVAQMFFASLIRPFESFRSVYSNACVELRPPS